MPVFLKKVWRLKIKYKLICLIFGLLLISLASAVESDKTYVFRIQKEGFYVNPVSLELFNSPFSEDSNLNDGSYSADLTDKEKILYSVKFDLYSLTMTNPTEECFENPEDETCQEELYIYDDSYADVVLNFPYFKGANAIDVYGSGGLIFSYKFKNPRQNFIVKYWYYFAIGIVLLLLLIVIILMRKKPTNMNLNQGF